MPQKGAPEMPPPMKENVTREQKKPSHEIDEIFSNKKRKKPEKEQVGKQKEEANTKSKKMKIKKKRKVPEEDRFGDIPQQPRKKTVDGLTIYTEEELGIKKSDAGGTPLCPFDCSCCF